VKILFCLAAILALAGCGTLPEPFYGNPGPVGARLAVPPAPVLMVPSPGNALLADQSAALFAKDLATALANADVPCVAGPAGKTDWRLSASATLSGNVVIPAYAITGPDGKLYGKINGAPVAAAAWANGDAATLNQAANTDAGPLTKLLAAVNAQIQGGNPDSLENRPPRVYFGNVTGAPGDGDTALALNMSRDLPTAFTELVTDAAGADFTVNGVVKTQPDTNGQILVEIDWMVFDSNKRKIGQVTQLHDLDPADITPYWGDVAAAAATEAATGVNEVISNAVLHKGAKG
jgi:hypothetical protein